MNVYNLVLLYLSFLFLSAYLCIEYPQKILKCGISNFAVTLLKCLRLLFVIFYVLRIRHGGPISAVYPLPSSS